MRPGRKRKKKWLNADWLDSGDAKLFRLNFFHSQTFSAGNWIASIG